MTTAESTAARSSDAARTGVPVPRPAPAPEDRRHHDGSYWDVDACAWRPSPGR